MPALQNGRVVWYDSAIPVSGRSAMKWIASCFVFLLTLSAASAIAAPPVIEEIKIGARSFLPKKLVASEISFWLISGSA